MFFVKTSTFMSMKLYNLGFQGVTHAVVKKHT